MKQTKGAMILSNWPCIKRKFDLDAQNISLPVAYA